MKYLKYFTLLLFITLITGCQIEYNINIDDQISEEINIKEKEELVKQASTSQMLDFNESIEIFEKNYNYHRELLENNNYAIYQYTKDFTYQNYSLNTELNQCFNEVSLTEQNNIITLSTSDEITCSGLFDFDSFNINIKTNYQVLESNADTINNNTYTWKVTPNNIDKNIYIKIKKVVQETTSNEEDSNTNNIIILLIFIFLIIIFIILKKKK